MHTLTWTGTRTRTSSQNRNVTQRLPNIPIHHNLKLKPKTKSKILIQSIYTIGISEDTIPHSHFNANRNYKRGRILLQTEEYYAQLRATAHSNATWVGVTAFRDKSFIQGYWTTRQDFIHREKPLRPKFHCEWTCQLRGLFFPSLLALKCDLFFLERFFLFIHSRCDEDLYDKKTRVDVHFFLRGWKRKCSICFSSNNEEKRTDR